MKKHWFWLALALAAFLAITYVVPSSEDLAPEALAALGVAVFAIIVWMTQAVSSALSGFMIVFLLAVSGATDLTGALTGYSNNSLWLIVIGFIMAAAMEKSQLSKRIALSLVRAAGGSPVRIYWAVAAVLAVLTFLVPSITARTLLMMPIVLGIGDAFQAKPGKSNIVKALIFIVAMSGTMMSIGVLTGHVGNPITAGLIEEATGEMVSWSEWLFVGGPPAFILAFISVFVIQKMWKPEFATLESAGEYVSRELANMGRMSRDEKYTLVVFLMTLALWATDSIHGLPVAVVGFLSVIALLLPDVGAMTWKEAQPRVPWDVFVLYGAGLSMGTALTTSGAAKWLASTLFSPLDGLSIPFPMIIMIWAVTLLQVFFTGGGPKTTALTPIVIAHATMIGADPRAFAMVLGMNMHHQYLLPVSNMPNAVAMGTGEITSRELNKTGAVMSVLAAAFMSLAVVTYWSWIGLVG